MFLSNHKRWFFLYINSNLSSRWKVIIHSLGLHMLVTCPWPQLISQVPITLGQKIGNVSFFPATLLSFLSNTMSVFPGSLSGPTTRQATLPTAGSWHWAGRRKGGWTQPLHKLYSLEKTVLSCEPQFSHLWKGDDVYLIGYSEGWCKSIALKRIARPLLSFAI